MANHFDLTGHQVDIDKVIDTYLIVQKEHGNEKIVELKEKDFEDIIGNNNGTCDSKKCSTCKSHCKSNQHEDSSEAQENKVTNLMAGKFVDDEDEDDLYVCEYCTAIGYSEKYQSDLCDDCTCCETCSEYIDGDCDGCSYSVFRDGEYYYTKLGIEQLLCAEDLDIINSIGEEKVLQRFNPSSFTVLNY